VNDTQVSAALTPRQEEIRLMLRQGMSNKMIAAVLGISEGTVKNHVTEILRVLNANNRTQAAQQQHSELYDIDEYLHLAMHASSAGDIHTAMTHLKQLLQLQPGHALAIYLLATQHAEIGLFERAIKGMRAAIALNPQLEMARFQLGLLLVDRGRPAEAKEQFAGLTGIADPVLKAYSEAMVAVIEGDLQRGIERLTWSLGQDVRNPGMQALAGLMRRVLERVSAAAAGETGKTNSTRDSPVPGAGGSSEELFLGAYRQAGEQR